MQYKFKIKLNEVEAPVIIGKKIGTFEIIDEHDKFHMEELSVEFPQYKFPEELLKFYQDYPDRKNSITIHTNDLKKNLSMLENYENNKVNQGRSK